MTLRVRLIALIVWLTAFVGLATTWLYHGQLLRTVEASAVVEATAEADQQSSVLSTGLDVLRQDAALLGEGPDVRALHADGAVRRLEQRFLAALEARPNYEQVRLIGWADGGRELVRVDRYGPSGASRVVPPSQLQPKGDRTYVREAMAWRGPGALLSNVELNRENGEVMVPHRPVVRSMHPVRDADGVVFGAVVINATLDALFDRVQATESQVIVTDELGRLLVHPDPGRAFAWDLGTRADAHDELPFLQQVLEGGQDSGPSPLPGGGSRVYAGRYLPLDGERGMAVVVLREDAKLNALADTALAQAALLIALFTALAALLGSLAGLWVAAPLEQLARGIAAVTADTPSPAVAPTNLPETEAVASAFNRAHRRMQDALAQLGRANEELSQLSAVASHDLQEPARTVQSMAGLLQSRHGDELDDEGKRIVAFMAEASERMLHLVRDILDHARLGTQSDIDDVDLAAVVNAVWEDLHERVAATGATLEATALPTVRGRPTELRLLYQNLIANALRYRRDDVPPRIRVGAERGRGCWRLHVTDNGQGVPEERRAMVFGMFRRGHEGRAEGAGIGLAHCRKIVALHGGRIWVDDGLDGGAMFCFELAGTIPEA